MDETRCLEDLDPEFKYVHSNVSHDWILNYPNKLKPDPNTLKISSKNEDYKKPEKRPENPKGKRKTLMEAFFRKIMSEEILGEMGFDTLIIEKYETDYSEHFKNPDDLPLPGELYSKNEKLRLKGEIRTTDKNKTKLEELKLKYPLYLSTPLSHAAHMTGRDNFRKNSTISRSPEQNYDNIEY